jgi:hypothetical protein
MAASNVERNVALLITEQGDTDLVNFQERYRGRFGAPMPVPGDMRLKAALQLLEAQGIVRVENRPTARGGTAAWVSAGPAAAAILRASSQFQYQHHPLQQQQFQQPQLHQPMQHQLQRDWRTDAMRLESTQRAQQAQAFQQQPLQPLQQVPQRAQLSAQEVTMSAAFLKVFIGGEFKNLNLFKKKYGVEVEVVSQRNALQGRVKVQGDLDAVQIAVSEIREAAAGDPQDYIEKMRFERWMRTHVYVDWSNMWLGACNGDPDRSRMRINVRALCDRVFAQRELRTLVVAGSTPTAALSSAISAQWSSIGSLPNYGGDCAPSVKFQVRAAGAREQGVDDMLIASAFGQVSRDYGDVQQTLVLVTGDGDPNGGGNWVRALTFVSCSLLSIVHQQSHQRYTVFHSVVYEACSMHECHVFVQRKLDILK